MTEAKRIGKGRRASDRPPSDADVEPLVRQLIDRVRANAPSNQEDSLIMDIVIDGVRVLLMEPNHAPNHVNLTPREREIGYLVAKGLSNKRIAATLGISSDTVSTHLRRMFAKLGVTTRSAMVAYLLELDLPGARGR